MTTKFNMNQIANINSIDKLAIYDKHLREHSLILARGDRDLAHDSLQNVYIQLDKYFKKYPDKIINGGLVSVSIRNAIKNIYKRSSKFDFNAGEVIETYLESVDNSYESIKEFIFREGLYEVVIETLNRLDNETHIEFFMYCVHNNIKEASYEFDYTYTEARELYKEIVDLLKKVDLKDAYNIDRLDKLQKKYKI